MYIRKVTQKNATTDKRYHNYRLVETYRDAEGKVRQRLLLNLGTYFDVPAQDWQLLANRVEEIMCGQQSFFLQSERIESMAQSIAARVTKRRCTDSSVSEKADIKPDYQTVDVNSLNHHNVRQIGAEHVGLEIAKQLGVVELLSGLKFNKKQINFALGSIIGRLVAPGSERSTHKYLQQQSALDELLGCNFQRLSLNQLYQISDKLEKNKTVIERKLFEREKNLFNLEEVITLYDLTNTYFEGRALSNKKASFGRSKEKRSDCSLVTLALVLDSSGFPKRTEVFEGNISEPKTLEQMIGRIEGKTKPTVVMDAGIATQANIEWLTAHEYHYIVVSRKQKQVEFMETDTIIQHNKEYLIRSKLETNPETKEQELYCYSELKAEKECSMHRNAQARFEKELTNLSGGLKKRGTVKQYAKVIERVGRLKEKHSRIASLYSIQVIPDAENKKAIEIVWQQSKKKKYPGVYCLRSNRNDLKAQTMWNIYTMLSDVEAAFKCLKSELGLRPIYHQKTSRVDSHIFISVIAYHILHTIRYKLKKYDIHESWETLRKELNTHCRLTSTIKSKTGKTIHIRKTSQPNPRQAEIYHALGIQKIPCKTEKSIF